MKLAVIGTGWIVKSFIDGLKFAPDFELFAEYSRSRERGETFAKENGISTVYSEQKNARKRKACHLRKADNRNAR